MFPPSGKGLTMQKDNKIFDDFAKMATGVGGMVMDMRREIEGMVLSQIEKILSKMNLVRREEFEAVREMACKARENNDILEKRLAEIENLLDSQSSSGKSSKK
jgi:BMFP domain-containing protein YqiC